MLTAYFDESGIHNTASATVIGGFLATNEIWQKIETEWQKHLNDFHVPYFHMSALEDGHEPLDKLRRELRYALYHNLVSVLLRHKPTPIAVSLIKKDWDRIDRNNLAAQNFFRRYIEPYDYCFDAIAQYLRTRSAHLYNNEPIALIFSEQLEFEPRSTYVYNAYKTHPEWADVFISLTYASMKKLPALQASDIMAHDTYTKVLGLIESGKLPAIEGLVKQFFDNDMPPYATFTDKQGLETVIAQGPRWVFPVPSL